MKNSKKTGFTVLIIVIAVSVVLGALNILDNSSVLKNKPKQKHEIKKIFKNEKNGYIAKLDITGVIQDANRTYNQEWLISTIKQLKEDSNNKAIALFINSPGGAVYEADEAYLALQDYKTSGKKIYAYQSKLAASGGYYISCAANKIYANRNTLTGSIGVISGSSFDMTELLSKIGIKSTTIHSGRNKTMFNYNEPLIRDRWQHGAGVLVEDGTVSWCCITNNQTGDASTIVTVNNNYGAGIHVKQGTVDHSIIALNTAYANGGGASHGGGLGILNPTGPVLVDTCLFYGNRAPNGNGGAICADFGNYHQLLTVRNTTIATNTASGTGGGVYVAEYYAANKYSFALANSLLADNLSGSEGADPNLALPGDDRIVSGYAAQSFGNLFANGTAALGEGSRSVQGSGAAWFVNAAKGNYRLPSGSAAIGVGKWYADIAEDLDRIPRRKKPAAGCFESRMGTVMVVR